MNWYFSIDYLHFKGYFYECPKTFIVKIYIIKFIFCKLKLYYEKFKQLNSTYG